MKKLELVFLELLSASWKPNNYADSSGNWGVWEKRFVLFCFFMHRHFSPPFLYLFLITKITSEIKWPLFYPELTFPNFELFCLFISFPSRTLEQWALFPRHIVAAMFTLDILGKLGRKVLAWLVKADYAWHDWWQCVCLWGPETPALFPVGDYVYLSVFVERLLLKSWRVMWPLNYHFPWDLIFKSVHALCNCFNVTIF